jgi:predicted nuclease with TOPRIM domain
MKTKDLYVKKVQAQLNEWDADIRKLRARADKASADAELEYKARIETLKREREKADDKLAELKSASDDAWEDLKTGLESATHDLGSALKSAAARF